MTERQSAGRVVEAPMVCDRGCDAPGQVGWAPCGDPCGHTFGGPKGGHRYLFCEGCGQFSYRPPHVTPDPGPANCGT